MPPPAIRHPETRNGATKDPVASSNAPARDRRENGTVAATIWYAVVDVYSRRLQRVVILLQRVVDIVYVLQHAS